ncbi:MAG: hypothetical protein JWR38_3754 [Mucilaginibacter sp.]|nr:hypothetical protein [Mucilaginibacter sp.]
MRKHLLLFFIGLITASFSFAQVTTSSITGIIKDAKGVLPGATVVATHVPSGSVYSTVSRATGQFTIPNMRVGGPYTLKITFVGYNPKTINDLVLNLGEPLKVDITLDDLSKNLSEVVITGQKKGAVISPERNGTSTNVSQRQLTSLPTLSRSIQDFTRFTPQAIASTSNADGSPAGISFSGQNNRYNQFTIDGASASDAFGLSSSGTNGGQTTTNPIPFESIQEVQVLLSPYDVTQGGFTGGGINAVTKSGTNDYHGSAYYVFGNQGFVGDHGNTDTKYPTFNTKTFGASLGGAIVKNKLFFFVNGERLTSSNPLAFDPSQAGSGSKFNVATLQSISDNLKSRFNYDPGSFTDINRTTKQTSIFGRLDWNIDSKNKLTVRHSYSDASNYNISRSPTSITFANSGYYMKNTTNSTVAELNSSFSNNSSNVLRVTYNNISDRRETSPFPNVQIVQDGLTYNIGADFSSSANSLKQNNITLTDNYTIYKDNHTITVGTDNQLFNTNNVFLQAYTGAYSYNKTTAGFDNIAAFKDPNSVPNAYTLNYSTKGGNDKAPSIMHVAQFSVYGQDVWSIKPEFKLTYGVRIDMPVYFNSPAANDAFNSSSSFGGIQNNQRPKSKLLFSPRAGFNWDINGEGVTQLRGGAGIFTGKVPLVWISNQYGGSGVTTIRYAPNGAAVPAAVHLNYDPSARLGGAYVPAANNPPATEVDVTDPNFKVPQIFRANLAIDHKLPFWGLIGTIEGLYTKNINNILYKNLNTAPVAGDVTIGNSTRPWYNFARVDSKFTDVLELTNTSKGYSYNITGQLQKPFSDGWTGMVAYTYGASYSLNDGTSSVALSNWRYAYNTNGLNNLDESRSNYDPGNRIIGYVSKKFTYAHKRMATTIGIVYTGQSGQPFSYTYSKNINGDDVTGRTGNNNANLVYVPSAQELNDPNGYTKYKLVDLTTTSNGVSTVTRTAAQQWGDLKSFIEGNADLKKNEGKVMPRNATRTPWENHFDLKINQDFFLVNQHRLQVSMDILNVGNLIDKNSGRSYGTSNQDVSLFTVVSQTTTPTFTFNQANMNSIKGKYQPYFVNDFLSRWRAQLTFRYSF